MEAAADRKVVSAGIFGAAVGAGLVSCYRGGAAAAPWRRRRSMTVPTPAATKRLRPVVSALATAAAPAPAAGDADLRYVSPPSSDAAGFNVKPLPYPKKLYPPLEPNSTAFLDAGSGHRVYYEESGKPNGVPALFLHGGPGGGCSSRSRQFFDPSVYRIVCLDQRGCGRSTPNAADDWQAALVENNTAALVADCEAIRQALGIEQWGLVLGGSWGSTLALALAEAHPATIRSLLLRGVFLFGPDEVDYLFSSGGTYGQHPQAWTAYCRFIQDTSSDWERESTNLLGAYHQRLTCGDPAMQNAAASACDDEAMTMSVCCACDESACPV
jgi:proline iminopeptidase